MLLKLMTFLNIIPCSNFVGRDISETVICFPISVCRLSEAPKKKKQLETELRRWQCTLALNKESDGLLQWAVKSECSKMLS
jgi:hypothetical protein